LPSDVVLNGADNVYTNFGWHCPIKIWDSEKRPKFGAI